LVDARLLESCETFLPAAFLLGLALSLSLFASAWKLPKFSTPQLLPMYFETSDQSLGILP
jgi:hypothetical protein